MRTRLLKIVALGVAFTLFNTGCMLSRLVDRAFIGISTRHAAYADRKTTGIFLLPLTFVIDLATFPLQALLVVIIGDDFPFHDTHEGVSALSSLDPRFRHLAPEKRAVALAELDQLLKSGAVDRNTSLALMPDGHWVLVRLDDESRAQVLARAQQPVSEAEVVACVP